MSYSEGDSSRTPSRVPVLSRRQEEVLELIRKGMTNKQIAAELHISISTVEHHLSKIYSKLGVTNRTQAAISFARLVLNERHQGATEPE